MKNLFIFLFIFFCIHTVCAQHNPIIDSLENIYKNTPKELDKANLLMRIYHASKKDENKQTVVSRLKNIYKETQDAKIKLLLDYCQIHKQVTEITGIRQTLFDSLSDLEKAYVYTQIDANVIHIWGLQAKAHQYTNQLNVSLKYKLKAVKALESEEVLAHDPLYKQPYLAISYIELAELYGLLKDTLALPYFQKGLYMMEKLRLPQSNILSVYANYAIMFRRFEKYDSALFYAKKAQDIIYKGEGDNTITEQTQLVYLLTSIYAKMGKTNLAIEELEKATLFINDDKSVHSNMLLYMKGKLIQEQKDYKSAAEVFKKVAANSEIHKTLDMSYNAYAKLSEVSYYLKDYKNAYKSFLKASAYKDSVANRRLMKEVKELTVKYETEKKEQQIEQLQQEKKIEELEVVSLEKQRLILGLSFLFPISLLIGGGWYVNRRRLHLQLEAEQKERAKQLSELKALRSQMNPHFIFNALNSIQDFILLNETKNARHYLKQFATLMRGFLDSSKKEFISLEEELPLLKSYIELEGLRLGEDFEFDLSIDETLDTEDIQLPPLLIQPYVENAFKHGLLHKQGLKKLSLSFQKTQQAQSEFVQITVRDNGVGRNKSAEINQRKAQTHQSFATQATEERLNLLKNQFATQKDISVQITDLYDEHQQAIGTEVTILIPTC